MRLSLNPNSGPPAESRYSLFSRSRLYAWHSWLGLLTGAFLILIGFSGSIAVFKHEIDWLVTPALRVSPPADARANLGAAGLDVGATGSARPAMSDLAPLEALDSGFAVWQRAYPEATPQSLAWQEGPRFAHVLQFRGPEGERLQAFLDPATGALRGQREAHGQIWPLSNLIRQFHVRLLMGFWGRVFVGAFGVLLFLSCLTGLFVYRNWLKTLWRVRWGLGWRLLVSDLHKSVGLASLLFNLLIGVTGGVLGLENLYNKARHDWMGIPRPSAPPLPEFSATTLSAPPSGEAPHSPPPAPSPGALAAAALEAVPGMKPRYLSFPSKPGRPAVLMGEPAGMLLTRNSLRVALDPRDGSVLEIDFAGRGAWSARAYDLVEPLHFGNFGGRFPAVAAWLSSAGEYAVKALWCALGLTPGLLALSGFFLWWGRKRKGKNRNPSRSGPMRKATHPRIDSRDLLELHEGNAEAAAAEKAIEGLADEAVLSATDSAQSPVSGRPP